MSVQAQRIKRKDHIPSSVRTEGKDEAANFIEEEIVDKGLWPMPNTQIAEKTKEHPDYNGWSRQHIANTIRDYFEPANEIPEDSDDVDMDNLQLNIHVPENVRDPKSYLQGFVDGFTRK